MIPFELVCSNSILPWNLRYGFFFTIATSFYNLRKLNLPEWYGNNLDGLWDMLTGFIETPINITVVFKPETKAVENLKENVLKIIETFKEAAEEDEEIEFNCEF